MTIGRGLGALAGASFVVSWITPAAHAEGDLVGGTLYGWQAALFALSALFGSSFGDGLLFNVWMALSATTNLLFLGAALLWWWSSSVVRARLAVALTLATICNSGWMLIPDVWRDLRVGYFLWLGAFAMAATAAWSEWAPGRESNPAPSA